MDGEKVALIDALLNRIASEYNVFLPLAIESGMSCMGLFFPRQRLRLSFSFSCGLSQRNVTPWPARDVIEFPPEDDLDANGWDLGKALRLLLKGNAVIVEWLRSPVVYRGQAWFRDGFLEFARRASTREAIGRHYLHLGERQRRVYFGDWDKRSSEENLLCFASGSNSPLAADAPEEEAIAPMHFPR